MIGDREASEDRQTFVPHVEHRADRLGEGHVERVQVLGTHCIVESHAASVIVQQDPDAPQVGQGLDSKLFAVVAHRPGVVAAAEHPGGRVFADPLVLGARFVGYAHSVPEEYKAHLNICLY